MNEPNESSYYEIALTNRQVVIAFVSMLTLVLAIFLGGVWVGKNASQRLAQTDRAGDTAPSGPAADTLANLEELKFFSEAEESPEALRKPDLSGLLEKPSTGTTLAQDVGSGAAPSGASEAAPAARQPGVAAPGRASTPPRRQGQGQAAPPNQSAPSQAAPSQAAPSQAAPQAAPRASAGSSAAAEGWVVQVFSTHDEPQARKVLNQVRASGHSGFLSSVAVGGQTMYRVRVGPFDDRSRAESISSTLRRELRLDPWVTAASN